MNQSKVAKINFSEIKNDESNQSLEDIDLKNSLVNNKENEDLNYIRDVALGLSKKYIGKRYTKITNNVLKLISLCITLIFRAYDKSMISNIDLSNESIIYLVFEIIDPVKDLLYEKKLITEEIRTELSTAIENKVELTDKILQAIEICNISIELIKRSGIFSKCLCC